MRLSVTNSKLIVVTPQTCTNPQYAEPCSIQRRTKSSEILLKDRRYMLGASECATSTRRYRVRTYPLAVKTVAVAVVKRISLGFDPKVVQYHVNILTELGRACKRLENRNTGV